MYAAVDLSAKAAKKQKKNQPKTAKPKYKQAQKKSEPTDQKNSTKKPNQENEVYQVYFNVFIKPRYTHLCLLHCKNL